MNDWGILGHTWAVRLLQNHIQAGRTRHAYLFTGPRGVGRRTLALRVAQALNCVAPPAPGAFCGQCRPCTRLAQMQHPDLFVVQSAAPGNTLKVEQVRNLQQRLALAPYEARYKIALLLRFEEAHPSAANALLKTLEEPPENVVLLLTASDPESLLPTIVSRCEVVRLRPLPLHEVSEGLRTHWGLPSEEARLLAHLSAGRPGYALQLHRDATLMQERRKHIETLLDLLPARRVERFSAAEKLSKDRAALPSVLQTWLTFWRDLMLRASGARIPIGNLDYEAQIAHLGEQLTFEEAGQCTAALQRTLTRLQKNVNYRLALEVFLLDMPRLQPLPRA
ncbi:MAG: DNA polymerase III subunit delta' [Anaerolineae bacterium]|nr:MAG: DNA polymerase III subunit delta' [Anaerolineae bacterium]